MSGLLELSNEYIIDFIHSLIEKEALSLSRLFLLRGQNPKEATVTDLLVLADKAGFRETVSTCSEIFAKGYNFTTRHGFISTQRNSIDHCFNSRNTINETKNVVDSIIERKIVSKDTIVVLVAHILKKNIAVVNERTKEESSTERGDINSIASLLLKV